MRAFLDTSSLVKLYDPTEAGVNTLLASLTPITHIILSELTQVEVVNAFQRKVRRGDLLAAEAVAVLATFKQSQADYEWIPLSAPVLTHASQLLQVHSGVALRSLDAIQLACALAPAGQVELFFAHDQRLITAAEASGLRIG